MKKKVVRLFYISFICLIFISCQSLPSLDDLSSNLYSIYPQSGTVFPPEIQSPTFRWDSGRHNYDHYTIFAVDKENNNVILSARTNSQEWKPATRQWKRLKMKSGEQLVELTIVAYRKRKAEAYTRISFSTSSDSVIAPIFYRNVPLPFSHANKHKEILSWHLGDISKKEPKLMLTGIPVCANCHSFSADGSTYAMDVDYSNDKGNYAIAAIEQNSIISPDKIISWSDYKREDGEFTFALLSHISPNGRYVVSTIRDRSIFVPIDNLEYSQLFFPFKGILGIYDRETNTFWPLPGADDPDYVQSNPVWSPDGKEILFTRAKRYYDTEAERSHSAVLGTGIAEEFLSGKEKFKYDIYRIPFNDGKGGIAEPVEGASNNGKSNYFPRYSPDGKWIVYCQADNFMLLQKNSTLYILPAAGGIPRRMRCNTNNMNSWHSFSPNGKWMVFSTKAFGPYTQLMLTHIDENGNDSPPVLLESFQTDKRAANIPEFVNINYEDFNSITDGFTETGNYYLRSATELYLLNETTQSERYFDKAISLDPDNYKTHFLKVRLVNTVSQDELKTVLKKINTYLRYTPNDINAILDRAEVHLKLNQIQSAISDCEGVLKQYPQHPRALNLLASIQAKTGNSHDALQTLNRIIEFHPENAGAWSQRGLLHYKANRLEKAIHDAKKSIELDDSNHEYYINLGIYHAQAGYLDIAENSLNRALAIYPNFYYALYIKGLIHRQQGRPDDARINFQQSLYAHDKFVHDNPSEKSIITRSMIQSEINRIQ